MTDNSLDQLLAEITYHYKLGQMLNAATDDMEVRAARWRHLVLASQLLRELRSRVEANGGDYGAQMDRLISASIAASAMKSPSASRAKGRDREIGETGHMKSLARPLCDESRQFQIAEGAGRFQSYRAHWPSFFAGPPFSRRALRKPKRSALAPETLRPK
jgi:hypothetical protein